MTNEQLLIYLYGIYPEGGWTVLWSILLIASIAGLSFAWSQDSLYDSSNKESCWHVSKSPWVRFGKLRWIIPMVLVVFILISNLIPDKKTFLLLVAAPTIMESIESPEGKLNKINKLFDKALDKADKYIDKQ